MKYEIKPGTRPEALEVYFDGIPDKGTRDALKAARLRWNNNKKCWYGFINEAELENILNGGKAAKAEKKELVPLWDRAHAPIPEHAMRQSTKDIAKQTRDYLKKAFPEMKINCHIGAGGWAALNEVWVYIKEGPYTEDGPQLEAIADHIKAWLWSYNYDNSDPMTDYFDRGFYEMIDISLYTARPATADEANDAAAFLISKAEFEKAEQERRAAEYEAEQARLAELEKEYQIINAKRLANLENIEQTAIIEDLETPVIIGGLLGGCGKEANLDELKKSINWRISEGRATFVSAEISRKITITPEQFTSFCDLFMYDSDLLAGFGGYDSATSNLVNCIAVYADGLQLVIDPEGYKYARYVYIPNGGRANV